MKITDVKCAVIANSPVIRITTDEGITGWSQIETPKPYMKPAVLQLKDYVVGEDPVNVERVVRRIRARGAFKPWGAAVSAIETALWDIAGKALGVPAYRLLGGKVRDRVRTYRTLYHREMAAEHSPAGYARWADAGLGLPGGFTMFKLPTAFHSTLVQDVENFHYGEVQRNSPLPYPHKGLMSERGFRYLIDCVTAARERLGTGVGLAIDAGPGFLPHDALRFAKALEPLHLLWLEDMISGDYTPYVNADVYRDVTHNTTTPIHTGEQIYLRQNFKALIETHAVNIIGPDPADVGGLAELKWVAEYADLHGIAIAPHGTGNGIFGLAALIQVCATLPDNLIAFEYPARFEEFWYEITEGFDGIPVKDGLITVPDRPGLGVEFIPEAARRYLAPEDAEFFD
ncbi:MULTISPECIES: mandelate racemase/muconate lactonizing enzyme family protein [unclassified Chelatococcus]|uniref:mandelate racemase/muconate lactonizing enzyme family protein n=1 Tax=unclassified Chelatococcus TaxID=2638111 RepID=UPI001BD14352|nr:MULTISPECIES: mandelate racemase/muconate lactonizing enzyme family protein [unclassified Chelatococcus]MBS7700113.1 mandelate racemase/muconate lactonizing enzyme family protein [Chelatococcus sp. YT9]MBX3556806.1 mandelate racemase/muconate lactonizing enzyme family protein [Chelatococcus sp.]